MPDLRSKTVFCNVKCGTSYNWRLKKLFYPFFPFFAYFLRLFAKKPPFVDRASSIEYRVSSIEISFTLYTLVFCSPDLHYPFSCSPDTLFFLLLIFFKKCWKYIELYNYVWYNTNRHRNGRLLAESRTKSPAGQESYQQLVPACLRQGTSNLEKSIFRQQRQRFEFRSFIF